LRRDLGSWLETAAAVNIDLAAANRFLCRAAREPKPLSDEFV
jgi:hypothetical protein